MSLRIDCYCNLYTGLLSCKEEQHTGEKLNENKKCDGEEYESLPCGFIWRSFDPPLYVKAVLEGQESFLGYV